MEARCRGGAGVGTARKTSPGRDGQVSVAAGDRTLELVRLDSLAPEYDLERLPFALRVLFENVLRAEALGRGSPEEVRAIAGWDPAAEVDESGNANPRSQR